MQGGAACPQAAGSTSGIAPHALPTPNALRATRSTLPPHQPVEQLTLLTEQTQSASSAPSAVLPGLRHARWSGLPPSRWQHIRHRTTRVPTPNALRATRSTLPPHQPVEQLTLLTEQTQSASSAPSAVLPDLRHARWSGLPPSRWQHIRHRTARITHTHRGQLTVTRWIPAAAARPSDPPDPQRHPRRHDRSAGSVPCRRAASR
jgi:hypothetical protein